jgi:hypothetical protein
MAQPVKIDIQLTGGQATADGVQRIGQAVAEMAQSGSTAMERLAAATERYAVRGSGVYQTSAEAASRAAATATTQAANQSAAAVEAASLRIQAAHGQDLAAIGAQAREAGGGIRSIVDSAFRLVGIQSPFNSGLAEGAGAAAQLAEGTSVAAAGIGAVAAGAVAAVAAVGALGAILFSSAKGAAAFNDATGKEAERAGLAADEFSRLRYAAEVADVSSNQLKSALERVGAEALKNTEEFQALGIATLNASGEQKSAGELLLDAADKFAGYEQGIAKTTLAQKIFGTQLGNELLPFLNQGRAGIAALGVELDRYGGTVTPQAAAEGNRLGDSVTRLGTAWDSLRLMLGTRLVPAATEVLELLVRLTSDTGALGGVMDLVVIPIKNVTEQLHLLADVGGLATSALASVGLAGSRIAVGDFAGASEALKGLTADFEEFTAARNRAAGGSTAGASDGAPKTAAPVLETAEQKAAQKAADKAIEVERKRLADLLALRQRGEVDLAAIVAKGGREALDEDLAAERVSFEAYYDWRGALIETEFSRKIELAAIARNQQEDFEKAEAQFAIESAKATEEKRNANEALRREMELADERRMADAQRALDDVLALDEQINARIEATRAKIREIDNARGNRRARINDGIQDIQSDPNASEPEKRQRMNALLREQAGLLDEVAAAARQQAQSSNVEEELEGKKKLLEIDHERVRIERELRRLERPGFVRTLRRDVANLADEWGQVGRNVAGAFSGTLQNNVNSFGDTVLSVAKGMKTWGEVGLQAVDSLASAFITAMGQMVVSQGIAFLTGESQKKAATAGNIAAIPAATTLAAAESGITFGSSAFAGLLGFLALMGAVAGATALAFESGGRVPGGEQLIRVNERGQETVVNAPGTSRFGGLLDAINAGATSFAELRPHLPQPDYAASAGLQRATAQVAGRAQAAAMPRIQAPPAVVHIYPNASEHDVPEIMKSHAGQQIIMHAIQKGRGRLGLGV